MGRQTWTELTAQGSYRCTPVPSSGERRAITQDEVAVARDIDLRPTHAELLELRHRIEIAGVEAERAREILHWVELGSYSTALDVVARMIEQEPRNLTLVRLLEDIRAGSLFILEDRLGSRHQRVLLRHGPHGAVIGSAYLGILALAEQKATLGEIVRSSGPDPLRTLERVGRLVRHGDVTLCFRSSEGS